MPPDLPVNNPPPDRVPKLAVVGLVLAFIPCCPMTALGGALLGLIALRRLPDPVANRRGRRVAITAVISGVALSCLWLFVLERARITQDEANERAMVASVGELFAADTDPVAAATAWSERIETRPRAEDVAAFLAECEIRYGALDRFSPLTRHHDGPMFGPFVELSGVFHFEKGRPLGVVSLDVMTIDVELDALAVQLTPVFRFRSVTINDATLGDLHLPATENEPSEASDP